MRDDIINAAVESIHEGKLVGLPTETVYGLAAPINNEKLLSKIFELKERPFFDPLIVHVSSVEQAKSLVTSWPAICDKISKKFWPGPVTLVLEKNHLVSDLITSGLKTVGIRIPKSEIARKFISSLGHPVAAPSANLFKKVSPTQASHVSEVFKKEDVYVIDGGPCEVGIESTIVKVTKKNLEILRPGLVSAAEFQEIAAEFKYEVTYTKNKDVSAPGMLQEHYCPIKPLNLVFADSLDQASNKVGAEQTDWFELSSRPEIAARELYQKMREACLGSSPSCSIWFDSKLKDLEAWRGILDRLKKASTKIYG